MDEKDRTDHEVALGGAALAPGDHLCVFHRGRAERDRLLVPFLTEGMRAGDAVFYLAAEGERKHFRERLAHDGDLLLTEPENGHLRDGEFAPDALFAMLDGWAQRKLGTGDHPVGRIAGDMSWAAPRLGSALINALLAEEAAVTAWGEGLPLVVLCFYDLDLFGGDLIVPLIKAHPKVWTAGMLVENPYYLSSAEIGHHADSERSMPS
ncbi:MEDS domain-containing protein [Amycolatopsis sp., V23-08]|uniref:MEDS domain-containing protein n=1 Tax=Amycolatopsis heterodermiae TaxID=3110235 RepID=A0ABU5RG72_9PSEU|nr:MEDS domain-containing protein [Amycolatopsis sp., V23-08]MEA5365267.1 MEDS domain-containing protein [Amycolatopsis sp., V23-08]